MGKLSEKVPVVDSDRRVRHGISHSENFVCLTQVYMAERCPAVSDLRTPPPTPKFPRLELSSLRASVLIASAFHPSYAEKMMTCAETATDFKGCMIVRKGLEGE